MSISRQEVVALRSALDFQLTKVSVPGYKPSLGGGKYDAEAGTVEFKLHLNPVSKDGVVQDQQVVDFKRYAKVYGLEEADLGRSFNFRGTSYSITGISPKRRKFPISAKRNTDGKRYKFRVEDVIYGLCKKSQKEQNVEEQLNGKVKRPESEILDNLRGIEMSLSPENLSCDGELPAIKVHQRRRELEKEKGELIKELGREPSYRELWPELTT